MTSDSISDLSFILGVYNPEVLLEKQISFGNPCLSVFSQTCAGVMLYGDLERLQRNVSQLPALEQRNSELRVENITLPPVRCPAEKIESFHVCLDEEVSDDRVSEITNN